jgi:addiction module HigA family antidote
MTMKNPPHPGGVVFRQCIEPLGLSITDAAALGVTRNTLSELVNAKRGISPEMAVRLVQGFRRNRRRLACEYAEVGRQATGVFSPASFEGGKPSYLISAFRGQSTQGFGEPRSISHSTLK